MLLSVSCRLFPIHNLYLLLFYIVEDVGVGSNDDVRIAWCAEQLDESVASVHTGSALLDGAVGGAVATQLHRSRSPLDGFQIHLAVEHPRSQRDPSNKEHAFSSINIIQYYTYSNLFTVRTHHQHYESLN